MSADTSPAYCIERSTTLQTKTNNMELTKQHIAGLSITMLVLVLMTTIMTAVAFNYARDSRNDFLSGRESGMSEAYVKMTETASMNNTLCQQIITNNNALPIPTEEEEYAYTDSEDRWL